MQWNNISDYLFKYLCYFVESFNIVFLFRFWDGYFKNNQYYEYDVNFVVPIIITSVVMFLYFTPWTQNRIRALAVVDLSVQTYSF